jgi:hypothetical protein
MKNVRALALLIVTVGWGIGGVHSYGQQTEPDIMRGMGAQFPTEEIFGAEEPQEPNENIKEFSPVSRLSNPLRFREIKAPLDVAVDEATFWGRQISEHQLFLHLGIEDPAAKQKALRLHKIWEKHRNLLKANPSIDVLESWLPLLRETRAFQIRLLEKINSGQWIGWIFPLFITHITLELDYLVDKLNDIPYSAEDEIIFWNRINSEHAAFAAHLLDPSERDLVMAADKISMKFADIPRSEKEMWLQISLKAGKELDQLNKKARAGIKTSKVLSVIHPVLIDHVIREGERGIQILEAIKDQEPEAAEAIRNTQEEIESQNAAFNA